MQQPVYCQYRQFPSSFNLVGLRARMRLHEINSEVLPQTSRNKSLKDLYKISSKLTLKSIRTFNREKSLPEIIKQEGKIASSLISTERKYQNYIQKKYTIKIKPKLKLTTTFFNNKPLSLKMSSSTLSHFSLKPILFNRNVIHKSKTMYLSLKNKYFKMTSHALINISTFKTTKRDNQIGKKDGFDFDKVKLFDYVRIKKK